MSHEEIGNSIFLLLLLSLLVWVGVVQVRYWLKLFSSRRWPSTNATICKGAVGRVSGPKGSWAYGSFFEYSFDVQGVRYVGPFALIANEEHAQTLQKSLAGLTLNVRYDPADPNVSVIVDRYDPRFEGLAATQNPDWLDKTPELGILEVIEK